MRARDGFLYGAVVTGFVIGAALIYDTRQAAARVAPTVVVQVAPPPRPAADQIALAEEVDVCRERTDNLRFTLETLIRAWPGRARLPEPPAGWPKWPEPGIARKWRAAGW